MHSKRLESSSYNNQDTPENMHKDHYGIEIENRSSIDFNWTN